MIRFVVSIILGVMFIGIGIITILIMHGIFDNEEIPMSNYQNICFQDSNPYPISIFAQPAVLEGSYFGDIIHSNDKHILIVATGTAQIFVYDTTSYIPICPAIHCKENIIDIAGFDDYVFVLTASQVIIYQVIEDFYVLMNTLPFYDDYRPVSLHTDSVRLFIVCKNDNYMLKSLIYQDKSRWIVEFKLNLPNNFIRLIDGYNMFVVHCHDHVLVYQNRQILSQRKIENVIDVSLSSSLIFFAYRDRLECYDYHDLSKILYSSKLASPPLKILPSKTSDKVFVLSEHEHQIHNVILTRHDRLLLCYPEEYNAVGSVVVR
jgi:hypothetical protein